ncbi:hypothetical protein TNCV_4307171 [Trichonephila clavipes]|nr:hypothetical protein TNCV_4307171 [Trichonephila clavipes]
MTGVLLAPCHDEFRTSRSDCVRQGNDVIRSPHPFEEKAVGETAAIGRSYTPVHACPYRGASPSTCVGPGQHLKPRFSTPVLSFDFVYGLFCRPALLLAVFSFKRLLASDINRKASNMLVGRAINLQVLVALSLALVVRGAYLIDFSRVFHHNLANVKREGRKIRFYERINFPRTKK